MYPLTMAAAIESNALLQEVRAAIEGLPVRLISEQHEMSDLSHLLGQLERTRVDAVLLDVGGIREPLEEVLRKFRAVAPDTMIVALHTMAEAELILAAFRAGVNEFICPPLAANLRRALEWRSSEQRKRETARHGARTVAFLAAKGGCGATTLACHAAVELGRQNQKVLLADLDLEAGMVAFLTRAKSPYSVVDALNNIHRLDVSYWKALVSNGIPGVEIISAPVAVACKQPPRPEQVQHVLSFVRLHYDWTVVDLGRSLNPVALSALEEIDEACLITTLEIPALHQAKEIVRTLFETGYSRQRLRLVLNRAPKRFDIKPEELEAMIGIPVYASIPNNYPELYECYSQGKLLARSSNLGKYIADLTRKLAGVEEEKVKRRFALFG